MSRPVHVCVTSAGLRPGFVDCRSSTGGLGVSANRRQRGAIAKQGSARDPGAATPFENHIKREVTARMKQRLGLTESEKVPAEIQGIVDAAAREIAESSISNAVIQEVEHAAKGKGPAAVGTGGGVLAGATASDRPLLQEAEYLAAKKKALQAAGFSSEEAMRLLVAEVAGAGSRTT